MKTHTFQINAGESCTIDISGNCGTIIEGPAVLVMIKDDRNIAPKVEVNIKSCEASSLVEVIKEEIGECIKNRKVVW